MICCNCKKYKLILSIEQLVVSKKPVDPIIKDIFDNYALVASGTTLCTECGSKIVKGETYFEDDIDEELSKYVAANIQQRIECCDQCETGELIEDIRYSAEKTLTDEDDGLEDLLEQIDTSSTIDDLLYEELEDWYDLWDKIIGLDNIAEHIFCPNCGNGSGIDYDDKIDYGTFDRYTEVYTREDIDHFNHNFYGDTFEVENIISEMAKKFTFRELVKLRKIYAMYITPTPNIFIIKSLIKMIKKLYMNIAMKNPLMKKFDNVISMLYKRGYAYTLSNNRIVYRTRVNKMGQRFEPSEMWEPPVGVASHGRYNNKGDGLLYCANNKEIVKKEITVGKDQQHNIAKFRINRDFNLFPVNNVFGESFDKLVSEEVPTAQQTFEIKKQYVLTNLLSVVCGKVGYDGIVYCSTKDRTSVDYALYNKYKKNTDLEVIDIEV